MLLVIIMKHEKEGRKAGLSDSRVLNTVKVRAMGMSDVPFSFTTLSLHLGQIFCLPLEAKFYHLNLFFLFSLLIDGSFFFFFAMSITSLQTDKALPGIAVLPLSETKASSMLEKDQPSDRTKTLCTN